ncbi:MAG: RHS repeat-associated core domain-containing protein, partial [Bacteroidota bacterium]|nr:RHS repeat-associated core domain-containing protein [Bacteroidota bacterium]
YIDGIFEYVKLENGTTYQKNYVHIMDDKSRIAEIRVGTAFPGDIADAITYVLADQIGSSSVRLSTTGTVIDIEEYYPFGDSSLRTFSSKRYRYVGKEKDQESGLYYYGARYYAAWTCRFISVDPLAADYPFYTPYNYAGNKPINKIDMDGMQETNPGGGGATLSAPTGGGGGVPQGNSSSGGNGGSSPGFSPDNAINLPEIEISGSSGGGKGSANGSGGKLSSSNGGNSSKANPEFNNNITKIGPPPKSKSTSDNKVAPLVNNDISVNKTDALTVVPKTPSSKGSVDEGWGPMLLVPAVGPALQSGTHLDKGEYLEASIWFAYALADIFTLGYASKAKLGTVVVTEVIEEALPRTEPIISSIGAASRAEKLALKLKMNMSSPTTKQVLNSLDDTVEAFIANFRKASIYSEFPGGQGGNFAKMTVEEALRSGNTTVKKLLVDTRFIKR